MRAVKEPKTGVVELKMSPKVSSTKRYKTPGVPRHCLDWSEFCPACAVKHVGVDLFISPSNCRFGGCVGQPCPIATNLGSKERHRLD